MLQAISLDERESYVLLEERTFKNADGSTTDKPTDHDKDGEPNEDATAFVLGPLTARQMATIKSKVIRVIADETEASGAAIQMQRSERNWATVQASLRGIEGPGIIGPNGPVQYSTTKTNLAGGKVEGASTSFMDALSLAWVDEIGDHIWERHEVTDEEEKISGASS